MKKNYLFIFVSILFLFSCGSSKWKCPMKNVEKWQTEIKGKDVNSQTKALTALIASAEGDISQLTQFLADAKADAKLNLSWNFSKEVKKDTYKEVIWDKDVWLEIQKTSRAYCALYNEIVVDKIYKTDEQYNEALLQLKTARETLLIAKKKLEEPITK